MMNVKKLFLILLPIMFIQESKSMFFPKIFGNNAYNILKPLFTKKSQYVHKMEINTAKQDSYEFEPWKRPGIEVNTKYSYCKNLLAIIDLSFTLKNHKELDQQFRDEIKNNYHEAIDEFQKIDCLDNYISDFDKNYKNTPYDKKSDTQKEVEVLMILNSEYSKKLTDR